MRACVACLFLAMVCLASAYPRFQQELPNIPMVAGQAWPGVGHTARAGGGARNQFGKDFKAAGFKWTPALCKKDSDGDGFTNGQELGDPDCKWSAGQAKPAPARGMTLSHPGLADSKPSA